MRHRLLIFGFLLSIILISVMGIYALNTNRQIILLFKGGENHFRDITTAATEVSSYAKRAEGHLLLYLVLHRKADKNKFPKRIKLLNEQITILDQKLENPEARTILGKIKANTSEFLPVGNTLIAYHDKAMEAGGKFEIEQYQEAIFKLHENFSAVRKFGIELAALEIKLENELKLDVIENAAQLKLYMIIMITLTSSFALCLGYILIKMTNKLHKEISHRIQSEKVIQLERNKLKDALAKVKTLSGLLPICAKCKKIRDDAGYWSQIESYIEKHSEAQFSHGLCEECSDELYGNEEWYKKIK